MPYRKLEDIKEKIVSTTTKLGAKIGVHNLSARIIASACGISTHTIYNNFKSMRSLLDYAAQEFDRKNIQVLLMLIKEGKSLEEIYNDFLDTFISDKTGTLYYISYTNDLGFDPTSNNPRAEEFLAISKQIFKPNKSTDDEMYLLLWDYITTMGFYYAEKIIHNFLTDNKETRAHITAIVLNGVASIVK